METEKASTEMAFNMGVREYSIWQSLNHPNIVRCMGRSETTWTCPDLDKKKVKATVLFMEYVRGGELYDYVNYGGAFKEDVGRFLFKQIAEGVRYIHSQGISHLDLKLDNIFVGSAHD